MAGILTPPTPDQAKRMADALDDNWRVLAQHDPEFATVMRYYSICIRQGLAAEPKPPRIEVAATADRLDREPDDADTAPVDRLRRVVARVEARQPLHPTDATWFAKGASAYLQDAPTVRLDGALGLHPGWGEAGWWTTGPREERDALLVAMDRQLFGQLDIPDAARSIVALARRGQERGAVPVAGSRLLTELARTGRGIPGEKQVKNILRRARALDERVSP